MLGRVADMFIAGIELLEAEGRVARDRLVDLAGGGVVLIAFSSLATLGATAAAVGVTWLLAAAIGVGAALTIVGLGVGVAGALASALAWQRLKHGPREQRATRPRESAMAPRGNDDQGRVDRREAFRHTGAAAGPAATTSRTPAADAPAGQPPPTPPVEPIDEFEIEVGLDEDAEDSDGDERPASGHHAGSSRRRFGSNGAYGRID